VATPKELSIFRVKRDLASSAANVQRTLLLGLFTFLFVFCVGGFLLLFFLLFLGFGLAGWEGGYFPLYSNHRHALDVEKTSIRLSK